MSLQQFFGEHEQLSVGIMVLLFFIIAWSAAGSYYGFFGPHYKSINVGYERVNNSLLVHEVMLVMPKGNDGQVVYRSFSEPICLDSSCNIHILKVNCEVGTPYFAKHKSAPINPKTGLKYNILPSVESKIYSNEVGCFLNSSTYADIKEENLTVVYAVPMAHVIKNHYVHYLFTEEHMPISKLNVNGLNGKSAKSFIPKDTVVAIDVKTGRIKSRGIPLFVGFLLVFLFSAIPYVIWYYLGKEKDVLVPEYLHTIPDSKLEPWQVDVLTNGSFKISKYGIASILLELYVNHVLKFKEEKKLGLFKKRMFLINKQASLGNLSNKAKQFYNLIKEWKFKEDENYIYCSVPNSQQEIKNIIEGQDVNSFVNRIISRGGFYVMTGVGFLLVFIAPAFVPLSFIGYIALFSVLFLVFLMSTVFSRFKDDNYKEYLEWLAFKRMLMDFAQIQKYFKEDYQQWKSWLVYATALGAAKNLIKAMKELKLLPQQDFDDLSYAQVTALLLANDLYSIGNPSSSGAGGVVGAGGGFGGGGGGMR